MVGTPNYLASHGTSPSNLTDYFAEAPAPCALTNVDATARLLRALVSLAFGARTTQTQGPHLGLPQVEEGLLVLGRIRLLHDAGVVA